MAFETMFLDSTTYSGVDDSSLTSLDNNITLTASVKEGVFFKEKYTVTVKNDQLVGQQVNRLFKNKPVQLGDKSNRTGLKLLYTIAVHPQLPEQIAVNTILSDDLSEEERALLIEKAPVGVGVKVLEELHKRDEDNKTQTAIPILQLLSPRKAAEIVSKMDDKAMGALFLEPNWNVKNRTKIIDDLNTETASTFLDSLERKLLSLESDRFTRKTAADSYHSNLSDLVLEQSLSQLIEVIPKLPIELAASVANKMIPKDLAKILHTLDKTIAVKILNQLIVNSRVQAFALTETETESSNNDNWFVLGSESTKLDSLISDEAKANDLLQEFIKYDDSLGKKVFTTNSIEIINALDDKNAQWLIEKAETHNKTNLIAAYCNKVIQPPQVIEAKHLGYITSIIKAQNNKLITDVLIQLSAQQIVHLLTALPIASVLKLFDKDDSVEVFNKCLIPALTDKDNPEFLKYMTDFAETSDLQLMAILMLRFSAVNCALITKNLSQERQDAICKAMLNTLESDHSREIFEVYSEHFPMCMLARLLETNQKNNDFYDIASSRHFKSEQIDELCKYLSTEFWIQLFENNTKKDKNLELFSLFKKISPEKKKSVVKQFTKKSRQELIRLLDRQNQLESTDFDDKQQHDFWRSLFESTQEIVDTIKTVDASHWYKMLLRLSDAEITEILLKLPIDKQVEFIKLICTHSKATQVLSSLFKLSEDSTLKLIDRLGYTEEKTAKELKSHLSELYAGLTSNKKTLEEKITFLLGELNQANSKASVIKRSFRRHTQRVQDKQLEVQQRGVPEGFVKLTNTNHKTDGKNRDYYFDRDKIFPPMRQPTKKVPVTETKNLSGSFKKAKAQDTHYISFEAEELERQTSTNRAQQSVFIKESRNKLFKQKLSKVKEALGISSWVHCSIQPGFQGIVVKEGELISATGGADISSYTEKNGIVNYRIFERFCSDMAQLHCKEIFFRDIKAENLLYKTTATSENGKVVNLESPQLSIIDLDDLYTGEPGDKEKLCGTLGYLTEKLYRKKFNGDTRVLKACDDYAALLTILSTTAEETLNMCLAPSDYPPHRGNSNYQLGILDRENKDRATKNNIVTVLKRMIKAEHVDKVELFLADPLKNRLKISLHEVIDWTKQ